MFRMLSFLSLLLVVSVSSFSQNSWDDVIRNVLPETLKKHKDFVSLPNVATVEEDMLKNYEWVIREFGIRGFDVELLQSNTLPVFLATKSVNPSAKTILYYMHLDGQPVNPENWDQPDPFDPVLKQSDGNGGWETIDWTRVDDKIDPEWRIFGRAAADDKAPIMMMVTALDLISELGLSINYNVKIILDPQEEMGSEAFLSTLEEYKDEYAADYMVIMDGPAHPTNKPTLTFGCRGIASCSITTYGSKLPQHSGHYGNYVPNPVFRLSSLLASMKDEDGRVLIKGYYDEVQLTAEVEKVLSDVPDDNKQIAQDLFISEPEKVGKNYQESMQFPSLNIRQIETSWKGPGLKTIIPEYATAHIDVRLVAETDGAIQIEKIQKHIESQGFYVLDREPTDEERLKYDKIATFKGNPGVNAFRTELNSEIGTILSNAITDSFGEEPVKIRTMGGTVPIIPAINTLGIPALIVPLVNMDNNQHNPNENIRIGNIIQGIKMCMVMLTMDI